MKDKRGMEMAISTVVIMVLAIVFLIAMIGFLIGNWERFSQTIKGYSGSDEQTMIGLCENDCGLIREFDFCCSEKSVGDLKKSCVDMNISCSQINCEEVSC